MGWRLGAIRKWELLIAIVGVGIYWWYAPWYCMAMFAVAGFLGAREALTLTLTSRPPSQPTREEMYKQSEFW